MNAIARFPHGFFEGPKALGYDPATGIITNECDSSIQNTNHLLSIMGGFELMNELQFSIDHPQFFAQWLSHCKDYKQKAWELSKNKFRIPRLAAYAAWQLGNEQQQQQAWADLLNHLPAPHKATIFWTNDAATWTHDAIFLKEVLRK
jgi:thiol-disulfide isomerase/thioredoxin